MSFKLSIAPMMDHTDRHYRYLMRLMTRYTRLYTEMIVAQALIHGDAERFLQFDNSEHPIALQLGGSDPKQLAFCSKLTEKHGYDEINLNVGCPSDRVQQGGIGACLMAKPQLVADCIKAMRDTVSIPVTVKTRIGIDDLDSYQHLCQFVDTVAAAGCDTFMIHARKAWLKGLSPKENRNVPPLRYDVVEQIKQDFPNMNIILNGGIQDLQQSQVLLKTFDGVMLGRAAYHNCYQFTAADQMIFDTTTPIKSRQDIAHEYVTYMTKEMTAGTPLKRMIRHLLPLYQGVPGAKQWRRSITEGVQQQDAKPEFIYKVIKEVGCAVRTS